MKLNIRKRLMLYFTSVILMFGIIAGIMFSLIFSSQTVRIYRNDLEKRASVIADTISEYLNAEGTGIGGLCMENGGTGEQTGGHKYGSGKGQGLQMMGSYSAYVNMIDDIAMTDVLIVDRNSDTVLVGNKENEISYSELSDNIASVAEEAFSGRTSFSDKGGSIVNKTLTVGAPIYDEGNNVIAAVLLQTKLSDIDSSINTGRAVLLACLATALVLGIIASLLLSKKFTNPLKKIDEITRELTNGNYSIKTGVMQNDEIGSLAEHIDVLSERLKKASEESEALEQMRKDYISNISHELRTPVTVIRGSLEAICDGVITDKEKVDEYHSEMLKESIHLERMVNDLLELSRLQNPDYPIEKTKLNVMDVLSDSVRSVRHVAMKKKIEINAEYVSKPHFIDGDYGRLKQMFTIILDNAVKFSSEGQSIEVKCTESEGMLSIEIIDNGIGISSDDLPHIFERFYKTSDERNSSGTGLGLAIAKEIAERHGIILSAESVLNVGTTFKFSLYSKDV